MQLLVAQSTRSNKKLGLSATGMWACQTFYPPCSCYLSAIAMSLWKGTAPFLHHSNQPPPLKTPSKQRTAGPAMPSVCSMSRLITLVFRPAVGTAPAVNVPGSFYKLDAGGQPSSVTCPVDTYGPGLRKQRACVPCPPGYVTNAKTGQSSARACGETSKALQSTPLVAQAMNTLLHASCSWNAAASWLSF